MSEQAEQLVQNILTEYHPMDSHDKWKSVLRIVSRMATSASYKPYDRSLLNNAYTLLKMKYREWERTQGAMPRVVK